MKHIWITVGVVIVIIIIMLTVGSGDNTISTSNVESGSTATQNGDKVKELGSEDPAKVSPHADETSIESMARDNSGKDKAPNFTLTDHDGNQVSFSDFGGKAVIVNSWAVWCPFCKEEIPDFVTLQEEYEDEVVIIAINRQESQVKQEEFLNEKDPDRKLLYLNDPKDSFYKSIAALGMPVTLFVNADGFIEVNKQGVMPLSEMREHTRTTLGVVQ